MSKPLNWATGALTGGNPAGFPDYKPLNPWGRGFPKELFRPKPKPELYQIFIEIPGAPDAERLLPVGPKGPEDLLKPLCRAIEEQIARGRETEWANPHIVRLL